MESNLHWQCRMSVAASQGWDTNLLSHSLEFNHKTIFPLAFVFNLDIFKHLDVYPKPIRSDLPPQTTSLCKSCLPSRMHHLIFNPCWRLSLPCQACLSRRFLQMMEKSLCTLDSVSTQVHLGSARGTGTAGTDPSAQNVLCSWYKKALSESKSVSVRNFPFRQKLTQLYKKVLNVHGKMMLFQEARQWLHSLNLQSFSSNE